MYIPFVMNRYSEVILDTDKEAFLNPLNNSLVWIFCINCYSIYLNQKITFSN